MLLQMENLHYFLWVNSISRDPGSIPGSGRSPGEVIGSPLQYSWAPLVAQTVKNLPAMQATWLQSLSLKDSLQEGMAAHSSIPAWRIPVDRGAWRAAVLGVNIELDSSWVTQRTHIKSYSFSHRILLWEVLGYLILLLIVFADSYSWWIISSSVLICWSLS